MSAEEFQRLVDGVQEASTLLRKSQTEKGVAQKRELAAKATTLAEAASTLKDVTAKSISERISQFDRDLREAAAEKSVVVTGEFPFYELALGGTKLELEVLDPYVSARLGNAVIDNGTPARLVAMANAKPSVASKIESDLVRFTEIFKLSYRAMAVLSGTEIVRLKDVLTLTNGAYSRVGFGQDSTRLLEEAMDTGILKANLEPGRDSKALVPLRLAGEERYFQWIKMSEH